MTSKTAENPIYTYDLDEALALAAYCDVGLENPKSVSDVLPENCLCFWLGYANPVVVGHEIGNYYHETYSVPSSENLVRDAILCIFDDEQYVYFPRFKVNK